MSQDAKQAEAPQLPDVNQAAQQLFDSVDASVFFNKLAQLGLRWETEDEAMEYLKLGHHLLEQENEKKAQAGPSGLAFDLTAAHGLGKTAEQQQQWSERSQAAIKLMQDPGLYDAVLSCKAAEAQAYADHIQENQLAPTG
jgi:hypothetical protein